MPKTRYDVRRIRKIYPNKRRTPLYIDTGTDVEAFAIEFTNNLTETMSLTRIYNTPPAVIVTAHQDNVNAFVSNVTEVSNGEYSIDVTISHLPISPATIWVHGHAVAVSA